LDESTFSSVTTPGSSRAALFGAGASVAAGSEEADISDKEMADTLGAHPRYIPPAPGH